MRNRIRKGFESVLFQTRMSVEECLFVFVGQNLKTNCTENRNGQYLSHKIKILQNINTVHMCMQRCDEEKLCFGWLYDTYGKKCYLSDFIGNFIESSGFLTGSCVGKFHLEP